MNSMDTLTTLLADPKKVQQRLEQLVAAEKRAKDSREDARLDFERQAAAHQAHCDQIAIEAQARATVIEGDAVNMREAATVIAGEARQMRSAAGDELAVAEGKLKELAAREADLNARQATLADTERQLGQERAKLKTAASELSKALAIAQRVTLTAV
jgi:hypothetical protein